MKKMIIAAAALAFACVANAAAVEWALTSITDSPDVAKAANWVGYVMDASTYDTFSKLAGDKVASYVAENAIYSGKTKSSRGSVSFTVTDGNYAANETVSSYLVLFNNASAAEATYYATTATKSITIAASGADGQMGFGSFASATSGWTSAAVPEPTSGLLLLIGMAGLALKRKHA